MIDTLKALLRIEPKSAAMTNINVELLPPCERFRTGESSHEQRRRVDVL